MSKKLTEKQKEIVMRLKRPPVRFARRPPEEIAAEKKEIEAALEEKNFLAVENNGKVGDIMPDGSVFVAILPGRKYLYAQVEDAPLKMSFNAAAQYAAKLEAHRHQDWRLPSQYELDIIYQSKHKGRLKGTFRDAGLDTWYWTSAPGRNHGIYAQRFSDGSKEDGSQSGRLNVRFVRTVYRSR